MPRVWRFRTFGCVTWKMCAACRVMLPSAGHGTTRRAGVARVRGKRLLTDMEVSWFLQNAASRSSTAIQKMGRQNVVLVNSADEGDSTVDVQLPVPDLERYWAELRRTASSGQVRLLMKMAPVGCASQDQGAGQAPSTGEPELHKGVEVAHHGHAPCSAAPPDVSIHVADDDPPESASPTDGDARAEPPGAAAASTADVFVSVAGVAGHGATASGGGADTCAGNAAAVVSFNAAVVIV